MTVTLTQTLVPVVTATFSGTDVYARVLAVVAVPNPNPTSLSVQLRGRSRKLRLQIYTVNFRKVVDEELGPQGPDWVSVPLPPDFLRDASNATYYARVWTEDQHQAVLARLGFTR